MIRELTSTNGKLVCDGLSKWFRDLSPKWQDAEDLPKNGKSCHCIDEPSVLAQCKTCLDGVV